MVPNLMGRRRSPSRCSPMGISQSTAISRRRYTRFRSTLALFVGLMKVKYNWFHWERVVALQAPNAMGDTKVLAESTSAQQAAVVKKPEQKPPGACLPPQ